MEKTKIDPERIYTREEVSQYMGVTIRTVYNWTHSGLLPATKMSNRYRIKGADILKLIEQGTGQVETTRKPQKRFKKA